MSMCTILALGANSDTRPVTRSEKRAPQAMMRSASVMAMFEYFAPCMPTGPKFSGWLAGTPPLPMRVTTAGTCMASMRAVSSSVAPEETTPPPTYKSGCSASSRRRQAVRICLALPR
jgi:hypothetical protein